MGWMMIVWSVVSAALIVWYVEADDQVHGSWQSDEEPDRCACCRHDRITHEHPDTGTDCSQCPCWAFRAPG